MAFTGLLSKIVGAGLGIILAIQAFLLQPAQSESVLFVQTYPLVAIDNLWTAYSKKIQKDGRTIDRDRNYLTTSEGQSYSMLRAVWMDDKETFERVLKWTNNNLRKREDDNLFAWQWGQNEDGTWDVIYDDGGINTASDADQDIALALIFAAKRWNEPRFMNQAVEILNDIWETEVIQIDGRPYLVAGNWAVGEELPTLNPSYYSFGAYPIFAEVNPENDWLALRDTSYEVLEKATALTDNNVGLPADWVAINPITAEVVKPIHSDKTINFSDDAIRVPYRVALDWIWFGDQRAKDYLDSLSFFTDQWNEHGKVYREYDQEGNVIQETESSFVYGAILPYFIVTDPVLARQVYNEKLVPLYDPDIEEFGEELGYYSQNWVWFGMAFMEDATPNLYNL